MSRVNTYADPLLSPLTSSSSLCAPTTIVSPSIETLTPNWSSAAPSSAVSLARSETFNLPTYLSSNSSCIAFSSS